MNRSTVQAQTPPRRNTIERRTGHDSMGIQPVSVVFKNESHHSNLEQGAVFALEYISEGERKSGWNPLRESGKESRCRSRPAIECLPELSPQECFFSDHDPFVVEPENQRINQNEPPDQREGRESKADQKVTEIEGVTYNRIQPSSI